ncbi:RluA family pseudouridine synthase [Pelagicoccus sp. SDUM812003]|uniref:RluA family pseudouridine synthase n=1 Tax=Pelagicoccus sp. SDUM812003 TaxID=3041267 RepID=UPI0028108F34|nr:RluA family pseudouridine synthase [Pelagicoccus sp. SDUM812003]MDQ8202456.1 RluA family pseudouridine synthase [Pelagicoccus sp. SDUM812003]
MPVPLDILYQDDDLIVVDKPSGVLSEGGGDRERDLEQLVSEIVGRRAFCCHRLDRLTSGAIALRTRNRLKREFAQLFEGHGVRKEYWLLTQGLWDPKIKRVQSRIDSLGRGRWANVQHGGKEAVSTFQLLGRHEASGLSFLRGLLKTGRTHQLRLHALKAKCPIVGDPLYGVERDDGLFGLHCRSLRFRHPETGQEVRAQAEPPTNWQSLLDLFRV